MSWSLVFAGVSAASGLFNAYDEYHANREIRRDLAKIKSYLVGLKSSMEEIKRQNRQILSRLDELPNEIHQIVYEVVDKALLAERYSKIADIRDNFLILRGGRGYGLRSSEWLEFSSAMGYLFDHEDRISKVFDLINVCEIALVITKERSLPLVQHRLSLKIEAISGLLNKIQNQLESSLEKLKIDLDNKAYVVSHNLNNDLPTIDQLTYSAQSNRTTTQHYTVQECHWEMRGRYDMEVRVCKDVRKTRQVADVAFHNARDRHIASIESQKSYIISLVDEYGQLKAAIGSLEKYLSRISDAELVQRLGEEPLMYFDEGFEQIFNENIDRKTLPKLNEQDMDDYIDGCGGHCEEVKSELIQSDNPVFFKIREC